MWLSIWWELEKSDSESVLHKFNDCGKWQPDLHPSVAIGKLIVRAAKCAHLLESHFLALVYNVQNICLCTVEYVYVHMSISTGKWLCECV